MTLEQQALAATTGAAAGAAATAAEAAAGAAATAAEAAAAAAPPAAFTSLPNPCISSPATPVPWLPLEVVQAICAHAATPACAALSKQLCMRHWSVQQVAVLLQQQPFPTLNSAFEALDGGTQHVHFSHLEYSHPFMLVKLRRLHVDQAARRLLRACCKLWLPRKRHQGRSLPPGWPDPAKCDQLEDALLQGPVGQQLVPQLQQAFQDPEAPFPASVLLCMAAMWGSTQLCQQLCQLLPSSEAATITFPRHSALQRVVLRRIWATWPSVSALIYAAAAGHAGVCRALLAMGADPLLNDAAALDCAMWYNHMDICELLLQHTPHPQAIMEAMLQRAAAAGHYTICELLLSQQQQQHPAHADGYDSMALVDAASYGHLSVCQLLLSQPQHPARADAQNSYALVRAAEHGHLSVCQLLLSQQQHPARADAQDSQALVLTAQYGRLSVCQLLVSQPRHPARADEKNIGALMCTPLKGYPAIKELIYSLMGWQ